MAKIIKKPNSKDELKKLYKKIAETLETTIKATLMSPRFHLKARRGLVESIEVVVTDNGLKVIGNDYAESYINGRRPGATRVPIKALLQWMTRYNIRPEGNQTRLGLAFAIQNGIFRNGIEAHPFIAVALQNFETVSNLLGYGDVLANDIQVEWSKERGTSGGRRS